MHLWPTYILWVPVLHMMTKHDETKHPPWRQSLLVCYLQPLPAVVWASTPRQQKSTVKNCTIIVWSRIQKPCPLGNALLAMMIPTLSRAKMAATLAMRTRPVVFVLFPRSSIHREALPSVRMFRVYHWFYWGWCYLLPNSWRRRLHRLSFATEEVRFENGRNHHPSTPSAFLRNRTKRTPTHHKIGQERAEAQCRISVNGENYTSCENRSGQYASRLVLVQRGGWNVWRDAYRLQDHLWVYSHWPRWNLHAQLRGKSPILWRCGGMWLVVVHGTHWSIWNDFWDDDVLWAYARWFKYVMEKSPRLSRYRAAVHQWMKTNVTLATMAWLICATTKASNVVGCFFLYSHLSMLECAAVMGALPMIRRILRSHTPRSYEMKSWAYNESAVKTECECAAGSDNTTSTLSCQDWYETCDPELNICGHYVLHRTLWCRRRRFS